MPEFKIEGEGLKRDARFRRLSWGMIILLFAVVLFLVTLRLLGMNFSPWAIDLLTFSFFCAFFGSCVFAFREAISAAKREMVFVLDETGITRQRKGYLPVRIAFSEIGYLGEELGWLIVTSPMIQPKKIAIPKQVHGYEVLRAELAKQHPLWSKGDGSRIARTISRWFQRA